MAKDAPRLVTKEQAEGDVPKAEAEAKTKDTQADYVDINNPAHGNKTYDELQADAKK